MRKLTRKEKIILIITGIILITVILVDLTLFYTSFKKEGIGRGFSRYWSKEQESSTPKELIKNSLELQDFNVEFLETPQLVDENFELLKLNEEYVEEINYKFKTATVTSGRYINQVGESYDLEGYEVYSLYNDCNRLRILYSDVKDVQFIIDYNFSHPSCPNPTYSLPENTMPVEGKSETIYLYDLTYEFNKVFDNIDFLLEEKLSDLGYQYHQLPSSYSEQLFDYLDTLEGLIPVDSYGEKIVYLKESDESFSFIMFNSEGFPIDIEMTYEGVLFSNYIDNDFPITLENGKVLEYEYSRWEPDTCVRNPIHGLTTEGLKAIGEAIDGSTIFINENTDDSYLKNIYTNHYLEEEVYIYNSIEEDSQSPYSYEKFIESYPVIYWQAPFGKVLKFVRYDFIRPTHLLGCGYVS